MAALSDPTAPGPPSAPLRPSRAQRALLAIALIFLLKEGQSLLAPVVIAVLLTFVLAPLVRWLRRRGIPEVLGAALVVGALLASVMPLAATLTEPAATWWQRAPETVSRALRLIDRLRAAVPGLGPPAAAAAAMVQPLATAPLARPGLYPVRAAPAPTAAAATAASMLAPATAPDPIKERLANEGVTLTGVVLGRGMALMVSASATLILLYFLLTSEHWLLPRTVAAVPRRRARALLVESNLVSPWVVGRQLQLSPLAIFLSVMFWGWLWGVAGAVIAVPMLIGIRSVCRRRRELRQVCHYLDGNWRPPPSLVTLLRVRRRYT